MYRMVLAEEELLTSGVSCKSLEMGSAVVVDLIAAVERFLGSRNRGLRPDGRWWPRYASQWMAEVLPLGSCGLVAPEVDVKLVGAEGKEDDREGEPGSGHPRC